MPVRTGAMCGALVIDSMPPATTIDAEPALIRSWPSMIAFMPEPHTLLIVVQPVPVGRSAASAAWRAGAWPRLAGSTQPMITSLTSAGATPDCSSAARMAVAPRVVLGTPVIELADREHVDDVRVPDLVDDTRLLDEAIERDRVLAQLAAQHLDRGALADQRVHRGVHH